MALLMSVVPTGFRALSVLRGANVLTLLARAAA